MKKIFTALLLITATSTHAAQILYGFSPEQHKALDMIITEINGAKKNIELMGYSFTSPQISKALATAQDRGVTVRLVLDYKANQNKTSQRAIHYLKSHGVAVRLNSQYPIMHDKIIIADNKDVETGSFNFSAAASYRNSENAIVIKDTPELAAVYHKHWQSRWDKGE